jgi:hypothetical protein
MSNGLPRAYPPAARRGLGARGAHLAQLRVRDDDLDLQDSLPEVRLVPAEPQHRRLAEPVAVILELDLRACSKKKKKRASEGARRNQQGHAQLSSYIQTDVFLWSHI